MEAVKAWDTSKPVPVFYFFKAKPIDPALLLPYNPKSGGWAL